MWYAVFASTIRVFAVFVTTESSIHSGHNSISSTHSLFSLFGRVRSTHSSLTSISGNQYSLDSILLFTLFQRPYISFKTQYSYTQLETVLIRLHNSLLYGRFAPWRLLFGSLTPYSSFALVGEANILRSHHPSRVLFFFLWQTLKSLHQTILALFEKKSGKNPSFSSKRSKNTLVFFYGTFKKVPKTSRQTCLFFTLASQAKQTSLPPVLFVVHHSATVRSSQSLRSSLLITRSFGASVSFGNAVASPRFASQTNLLLWVMLRITARSELFELWPRPLVVLRCFATGCSSNNAQSSPSFFSRALRGLL